MTLRLRRGEPGDLDAILALEGEVFTTDLMSRRSYRHHLASPHAALIVAEEGGALAGCVLVFFRPGASVARLYSIAVAPPAAGRGVGPKLLAAGERAARQRGYSLIRLEVQADNARAIARYRKAGYRELGRVAAYYEDGTDALRFEKTLYPPRRV